MAAYDTHDVGDKRWDWEKPAEPGGAEWSQTWPDQREGLIERCYTLDMKISPSLQTLPHLGGPQCNFLSRKRKRESSASNYPLGTKQALKLVDSNLSHKLISQGNILSTWVQTKAYSATFVESWVRERTILNIKGSHSPHTTVCINSIA